MPFLILVRHSVPDIDPAVPSREWHLSPVGRDHSRSLARRIERYEPAATVTSVEPKARETGQIMADELGIPFQVRDGLQENDRQELGLVSDVRYRELLAEFFAAPDSLVVGRETAAAASDRFHGAVREVVTDFPDHTIVVVAHGVVITLFVSRFNPIDTFEFWSALGMPVAVVLERDGFRLYRLVGV